jgi:RNA polymerase sigma-70 factor, ECF subfamily
VKLSQSVSAETPAPPRRLKSATVQRESYVGPWLPEPLVMTDDADRQAEQAEAISLAMLVVLETLSPPGRA